jgi:RimJ/RimL family protein N-acetyltransferase
MFAPLTTERLLLRPVRSSDAVPLQERRNHPEVAALQSWPTPYTLEQATGAVESMLATPDPVDASWFMLTVADAVDTTVYGDLALKLEWDGRAAEVGWTFAREHWGNGYASEAVERLLRWLMEEQKVTRVQATMHPDNFASARVAERNGFMFEGHTRNSYWVGDENSDDWIYGLTPELWEDWQNRPRTAPDVVELVEPYPVGLRHVLALTVHHSQRRFVSDIAASLAQAAVPPFEEGEGDVPRVIPWPRIIHADGEPVGFVMMEEPTATAPEPYLWRLNIDRRHQSRGIGARVLEQVIAQCRQWGAASLLVSYVEGVGSPQPFYAGVGFVPTGEIDDGETVARLMLG